MTEIFAKEKWDSIKDGPTNKNWITLQILFKAEDRDQFREEKIRIYYSIKKIVEKLEREEILESFHFLGEPFQKSRFKIRRDEYFGNDNQYIGIDLRIWIKTKESKAIAKEIIREELKTKDDIVDFCFWYFPKRHPNYCKDSESRIYYDIVCRIYELYCRFLFEKLDPNSDKQIDINGFSNWKIVHCFLNSQGMNNVEEYMFAFYYAQERVSMGLKEAQEIFKEIGNEKGVKSQLENIKSIHERRGELPIDQGKKTYQESQ